MHLRVALATVVAVTAFLVISNYRQAGADASQLHTSQQVVGQARAAPNDGLSAQSWNGMPAPSSTATEGNVVDLTH